MSGLQDSDDEDIENDIDQQIESMLAPKRIVKEIKAPIGTLNPTASAGMQIILFPIFENINFIAFLF